MWDRGTGHPGTSGQTLAGSVVIFLLLKAAHSLLYHSHIYALRFAILILQLEVSGVFLLKNIPLIGSLSSFHNKS